MRYNDLTKEEVKMLLDSATRHGKEKLIAYDLGWLANDEIQLIAIVKFRPDWAKRYSVNVTRYRFKVCEKPSYSEYLGTVTRLKFIVSSGGNWGKHVSDYFKE
jgi:hypothetical protein